MIDEEASPMTRIPHDGWLAVADGGKALVFRNEGSPLQPRLTTVASFADEQPATRDQGTDRPGRKPSVAGVQRAAIEQTDWHDQGEAEFLARFAENLAALVAEHGIEHLTLAAAPRALGVLRQKLPAAVGAVLKDEIASDFAHMPTPELERLIAA
jgi:protein required for attachment to host cells